MGEHDPVDKPLPKNSWDSDIEKFGRDISEWGSRRDLGGEGKRPPAIGPDTRWSLNQGAASDWGSRPQSLRDNVDGILRGRFDGPHTLECHPASAVGSIHPPYLRRSQSQDRAPSLANRPASTFQSPRGDRLDQPISWVFRHHLSDLICGIELEERNVVSRNLHAFWNSLKRKSSNDPGDEGWTRPEADRSFRVSFAGLQRINMRKLQCKLVNAVVDMRYRDQEPDGWEHDLKSYIEAIKDYDYMIEHCKLPRDPFLVTGERKIDDFVIRTMLGDIKPQDFKERVPVPGPWEENNQPIGGIRMVNVKQSDLIGLRDRFAMATLGGALLVGPMWLMVKRNDLNTSLVATTLFVVAFGLLMAIYLDKAKDVMSATAAYAAVLVVFVGLNIQGP